MKRACIIGWPVEHSRSPLIHGTWLKQYAIDGEYRREAVKPENVSEFLSSLAANGYVGCNVTVPHKEAAFQAADVKLPAAEAVGAANTLWIEDGQLYATNTDTYGFMAYLGKKEPHWLQGEPKVVVLGAGGAARAIIFGLLESGQHEIHLLNRTEARAQAVATHFGNRVSVHQWDRRQNVMKGARLVINTTSLGMNDASTLDVDLSHVDPKCVVCDIVYTPLETTFLQAAKALGLKTVDGLGMLLHQAVPGFEKWFGVRPDVTEALYQAIADDVRRQSC